MRATLVAAVLGFILVACSGKPIHSEGGDLTRVEVEYISRSLATPIEERYPLLKHKFVNRYVDGVGQHLVSRNPDMPPLPYEFRVLRTNEINIFSLPGGVIYVTLGLLRAAETEALFVAALAHELAHQQLAHALHLWRARVNAQRNQRLPLPERLSWEGHFIAERGFLQYGAGLEKEADQLAPVILYRANYDPRIAEAYLQWLQKMEAGRSPLLAAFRATHPAASERIEWIKESIVRIPPARDVRAFNSPTFIELKQLLKEAERKGKQKNARETNPAESL